MRGYYGIGAEKISKPMNMGALIRTAHAFGASFVFTVDERYSSRAGYSDTSHAPDHLPLYQYPDAARLALPEGCELIGIELTEDAVALPTFRHPLRAAYVLGSERGALSPELVRRCAAVVRIPTSFCVNLAVAGAIVLYDRLISMGKFGERPLAFGGAPLPPPTHVRGGIKSRRGRPPNAA